MKNKFTPLLLVLFTANVYSQVGIGTDDPKSTLQIDGSFQTKFKEIDSNYLLTNNDQIVQGANTSTNTAPITITLPSFTTETNALGRRYTIKNANIGISAANITLATSGSDLINFNDNPNHSNNVSTITLLPGEAVEVVRTQSTNGSVWSIIGYNVNDTFYSTDGTLTEQRTVTLENDASLMYFSNNPTNSSHSDSTPNFLIGNQTEPIFSVNNMTGKVFIGNDNNGSAGRSSRANTIPLPTVTSDQKFTVFGDVRFTGLPNQGQVESLPIVIDSNGVLRKGSLSGNTSNYTFNNGLNETNGVVKLGGDLNQRVNIDTKGNKFVIYTDILDGFGINQNTFSVDGLNNRVGIGTTNPTEKLDVNGNIKASSLAYSTNSDDVPVVVGPEGILKRGGVNNGVLTNGNYIQLGGDITTSTAINAGKQANTALTFNANAQSSLVIDAHAKNGLQVKNLNEGNANSDKILVVDSNNNVKTVTTITNDLTIPTPAVFTLEEDIPDFLKDTGWGYRYWIPMKTTVNAIPGLVITETEKKTILDFKPGIYQVTMVYEAVGNSSTNCTLSSYIVDFPFIGFDINENHGHVNNPGGNPNRVHSTASHDSGQHSNHGGTISFTFVAKQNIQWAINLGRGQSGDCTNTPGITLENTSTQLTIFRLGNAN